MTQIASTGDAVGDLATGPELPSYDREDSELFGLDAITHTSDQRSIGELLFDVDRHARLLLMDVSEHDAAPLLRAWPELISAAGRMWHAMPETRPGATAAQVTTASARGTAFIEVMAQQFSDAIHF